MANELDLEQQTKPCFSNQTVVVRQAAESSDGSAQVSEASVIYAKYRAISAPLKSLVEL